MHRLLSMSIRKQLLLIVLIMAIPAVLVIIYTGYEQRADAIKEAKQETQKLAAIIASEQRYRVAAAEQILMIIGRLPEVRQRQSSRVKPLVVDLLKSHTQYSNIFIADLEGNVWVSALPSMSVNVSDRRYFKHAIASGRLSSGEYIVSRFTKKLVITLAYPYRNEQGMVDGVICLGFDLDYFKHLLSESELSAGKSYLLLDHQGVVLARPINPEQFVGDKYNESQFNSMKRGPDEDTVMEYGIDGQKRFITYRKLRIEGEAYPYLYIRAAIPVEHVLAAATNRLLVNLGFFTGILSLALLLAWFIGKRSIADRISLLETASQRMAKGDLQTRVADRVMGGELGSLGAAFDDMAQQLKARDDEKTKLIEDLTQALTDIKTLQGIIPICSSCKKIRNEEGVWTHLEGYISEHTTAEFSHGICAECSTKLYPQYQDRKK